MATPHDGIGQGTWFMGEGLAPRRDEVHALQQGLACGLRLIDTAEMNGDGGEPLDAAGHRLAAGLSGGVARARGA